jgi:DNA-binding transcriptional MerR regulator
MRYRIGEFARLSGISAKTLRFYDEIGLLRPIGVDSRTRYRHYSPEQLQEMASILALRQLGVSLSEIRTVIRGPGSGTQRRDILEHLRDKVKRSIEAGEQSLRWINHALDELNHSQHSIAVVVKRRPGVRVASLRSKVNTYAEILPLEQELLSALPADSMGPLRGALWHRCADSGSLEAEPFVELKQNWPGARWYEVKQLPSITAACAYSSLEDDAAEQAYDAIRRWMQVRGYVLAGAKREIYLGGMLEIQFPLTSA